MQDCPGTVLTAGLIAVAGWTLLALRPAPAVILGAALASTDPVMMRGLLRGADVPGAATVEGCRLAQGAGPGWWVDGMAGGSGDAGGAEARYSSWMTVIL